MEAIFARKAQSIDLAGLISKFICFNNALGPCECVWVFVPRSLGSSLELTSIAAGRCLLVGISFRYVGNGQ